MQVLCSRPPPPRSLTWPWRWVFPQAAWDAHSETIVAMYNEFARNNRPGPHIEQLHDRALKHVLLSVMAAGTSRSVLTTRSAVPVPAGVDLAGISRDLLSSSFMSDKVRASRRCRRGTCQAHRPPPALSPGTPHPCSVCAQVAGLSRFLDTDAPDRLEILEAVRGIRCRVMMVPRLCGPV